MPLDARPDVPRVGRYDLIERFAVGGMADIFLAYERGAHGLERLVVIKRILPHLAQDESFVEMFFQEARTAARVNHPNVVKIFDLGTEAGRPYMAMEYVPGSTLRQLYVAAQRRGTAIPITVAINLIIQACAGAHAVHELRDRHGNPCCLVHRDLTPHNLMVTESGHVRLLDFGIAKGVESMDFTRTGMLKGKVAYLSPEQCRQEDLDRRSDVFTLGIDLWELIAGERLFKKGTEIGTLQAILHAPVPDLREVRPMVPQPVARVVARALHRDRDRRYPSADALRRALADAAAAADLDLSLDDVATYVARILGDKHAARSREVERVVERSLTAAARTGSTRTSAAGWVGVLGAVLVAGGAVVLAGGVAAAVGLGLWSTKPPARPPGPTVVVALAPTHAADTRVAELEPLRAYLERVVDRQVEFIVPPTYGETARLLLQGEVPYASLPPYTYIEARAMDPDVQPLAIHVIDHSHGVDGLLLVREDSPATGVASLRGARICYVDERSTSGYQLPRIALRRAGLDPDVDLAEAVFSGSHDEVLRDVIAGHCDVAATYSDAWNTASNKGIPIGTTRILATTGRSPHDVFCAGPDVEPLLTGRLQRALLTFDPVAETGQERLGSNELLTGFREGEDDDYDDLREVVAADQAAREDH